MKRVFVSLLVSFTVFPIYFLIRDFILLDILQDHSSFSGNFSEYVALDPLLRFLITPLVLLIFLLLPYNFILLYLSRKGKLPRLFSKYLLFLGVEILVLIITATFFINAWIPNTEISISYFFMFLIFAICCVTPLHYLVDKKEQKDAYRQQNGTLKND